MGRWHAHALSRAGVAVAAVVDRDAGRAGALARRCGGVPTFPDVADVPTGLPVDAAHVCTPPESHESLVALALERRWHVLVEKPFAESASATERLLDAAAERGLIACPVHQFVFQPGVRRIRSALPRLGPVRHLDMVVCSAGGDGKDDATRHRIAVEIVPHALSLFARLVPVRVSEVVWRVECAGAGEIRAAGVAGSATLSILVSMSGRPTRNTLRVIAERGTAHADLFHGFAVLERGAVSRARKMTRPFTASAGTFAAAAGNLVRRAFARQPAYPGLAELVASFHGAVRSGSVGPFEVDEIRDVARAWEAIRGAAGAVAG